MLDIALSLLCLEELTLCSICEYLWGVADEKNEEGEERAERRVFV